MSDLMHTCDFNADGDCVTHGDECTDSPVALRACIEALEVQRDAERESKQALVETVRAIAYDYGGLSVKYQLNAACDKAEGSKTDE